MEKIESFKINHLNHPAGIYLSRTDGDIFTYDVRMSSPYKEKRPTASQLHSLEHLLATILRNSECKDSVIYVGPMGCQTGMYILFRNIELEKAKKIIIAAFKDVANFLGEMPGKKKKECGYYYNLSIKKAQLAAEEFLAKIFEY